MKKLCVIVLLNVMLVMSGCGWFGDDCDTIQDDTTACMNSVCAGSGAGTPACGCWAQGMDISLNTCQCIPIDWARTCESTSGVDCSNFEQIIPTTCPSAPVCGDGSCESGENTTNCATDCGATTCGNGTCDSDETPVSCSADCPCTEASGEVYADIDYGTEGITVEGSAQDTMDTVAWGCAAASPGTDNMIWRIQSPSADYTNGLHFDFELPANLTSVSVRYYEMSLCNPDCTSQLEVWVNDAHSNTYPYQDGCPHETAGVETTSQFVSGSNRISVWSDSASGLLHGLQGVFVNYTYCE
ncbi:MAG: hypothetical protein ABI333_23230 [bacterium]